MIPYMKQTNMNADNALESRILPEYRGCYLFVFQKYIIQTLKRQRPHLSKNYPIVFKDRMGTVHISLNSCGIYVYNRKQSHKPDRFERPRVRRNPVQN